MRPFRRTPVPALLLSLSFVLVLAISVAAQENRQTFPFLATNYDVEAILHPEDQTISAQVKVDFVAQQVARTLLVELHPDLHVNSVKGVNGQQLTFDRNSGSPLLLSVGLPSTVTPGTKVSLTFDYAGPLSNVDDSPSHGVRFASIDKTSAYLLLPARWFPLTNYPSNRYTGTFKIVVPNTFAVAGTGKADSPAMMPSMGRGQPGQATYVFHCTEPGPVGTFVAGSLQLSPVEAEGYQFPVYTPPAQASTAMSYGDELARILSYFSDEFGQLQKSGVPQITIAQMPDGSLEGYSAPGLLLISAREWTAKANDRVLSSLAAGQWWGDKVLPASNGDVWLTDGLSQYGSALYAEQSDGVSGLHNQLDTFAVGALMYENTTPIAQAQLLAPYSDQYHSVIFDKGAMVFHMLRTELGDDAFTSLMKEFYQQHAGKTASIDDFEKMAKAKVPPAAEESDTPLNLNSFFAQWLNSTGVPEFSMDYIVYRTPKGFRVVGKVHQDLDTFRMPVDIRVDTEGNPEYKKIMVTGTTSTFAIETFGRPKAGGITIDPNNNMLKSSPKLRVRASVARGEALAQAGKYYEAIQEYQRALDVAPTNSLAHFRMGEAMFYQKNYQSAANAFRDALGGDLDPKWTNVWAHIYIGKIYDILGQRERAVNEYSLAEHTNDNTAGAQQEAANYIKKPYNPDNTAPQTASTAAPAPAPPPPSSTAVDNSSAPTLKRRTE